MSTLTTTAQKAPITPNFRINRDQEVLIAGHGLTTIKYLGKCPISGVRMYDVPGASYLEHQAKTFVAAEYGMTGPDMLASWLACNNDRQTEERALALAQEEWLPGPEKVGPTTSVVIRGRRWFDRSAGNTYFSAVGIVNGIVVARIGFEYGYDNQYRDAMTDKLEKLGFLPGREKYRHGAEAIWTYAERHGINQTYSASDVNARKDL